MSKQQNYPKPKLKNHSRNRTAEKFLFANKDTIYRNCAFLPHSFSIAPKNPP